MKCNKCSEEKDRYEFYMYTNGYTSKICKECKAKANKEWMKAPEKRRMHSAQSLAWQRKNKHVKKAYDKVRYAIRSGKIKRPSCCGCCGVECVPNGHHEDYTKPFDVVWLCDKCHALIHAMKRKRLYLICNQEESTRLAQRALGIKWDKKTIYLSSGKIKSASDVMDGEVFYSVSKNLKSGIFESALAAWNGASKNSTFIYKFAKIDGKNTLIKRRKITESAPHEF